MARVIGGQSYENARSELQEAEWGYPLMAVIENNHKTAAESEIKSSGYVIDTLNAAIWAVENSQSFEGAVLKAVNLGDDADTVGAVTGQIAGAIYGYSSVPNHLKAGLVDEQKLYVTSQFLTI